MKIYIVVVLIFSFFFVVSCQTTRDRSDLQEPPGEVQEAAEFIGEDTGEEPGDEEDLESEFADSEDFEKEMADSAFPSGEVEEDEIEGVEQEEASSPQEEEITADIEEEDGDTITDVEGDNIEADVTADVVADTEDDIISTESIGPSDTIVVINSIQYESGENKIYINGTGSFSYQSRENQSNNQFVIEIPGAILSDSLQERPFVMKDFNTEMALLQADQKDSNTVRIVVQMRENASMPSVNTSETGSLVISSGGGGVINQVEGGLSDSSGGGLSSPGQQKGSYTGSTGQILPAKSLEEFFLHTPQFTGRPISIHLRNVDVRDVLYFISEGTGLNMVLSEDVSGTISIKLRNVPWDQALITVMKTKKLGYVREGNVIRIMSLEALKKDHEDIQKMIQAQKEIDPLRVKVIPLVYKKADGMGGQVTGFLTKDRGKVIVDSQSNSLIVTDTARVIERIETMVKNLDKSPTQVMIEAKVIEARERFVRNLGIGWGFDGTPLSLSPANNPQLGLDITGGLQAFPGNVSTGRTVSSNLSVAFAPVGELDVTLGLSEAEDLINVISAPRVMVLNGERAKITQTTEDIDLVTTTQQGAGVSTSPQRVSANLEFEVSPQITALGSIFMDIKMKREFFGPPEPESGSRPINSREAETKVLVNNGQTIVIGGIYQHDETRLDEGIPILRHIPILKWLFSRFTTDKQRNELLLFLTPRIMNFSGPVENNQ